MKFLIQNKKLVSSDSKLYFVKLIFIQAIFSQNETEKKLNLFILDISYRNHIKCKKKKKPPLSLINSFRSQNL